MSAANDLIALLAAFIDCRPMADFDDHDDKFTFANFIDYSIDSLSDTIPFLCGKLYATFPSWIFT